MQIKGLVIDTPYIDQILSGKKIWEMRSSATKQRGLIALIRKGSGTVIGVTELVDSIGPFTHEQMTANQSKHLLSAEQLNNPAVSKWNHAWVMKNARAFKTPIPYKHNIGAVKWVRLEDSVIREIKTSLDN